MAARKKAESVAFRDTRRSNGGLGAVHHRYIEFRDRQSRDTALARAAASVWVGCGPVTIDPNDGAVFVGNQFLRAGSFTTVPTVVEEVA